MKRKLPEIIRQVGFDFSWDNQKVWNLNVPIEEMSLDELTWHFDIPFLWSKPNGYYDVLPRDVIENPDNHKDEYERTLKADTSYPIDIMDWEGTLDDSRRAA